MRYRILLVVLAVFILPGCSFVNSINNSLNYVEEATTYINQATTFAEQIPTLAEQAVTDPETREALIHELEQMKQNIVNFNNVEAPAFAEEIHQQLVGYNETLMKEIDGYLEQINNKVIDFRSLMDSEMIQTISEMAQILNRLQQLVQ